MFSLTYYLKIQHKTWLFVSNICLPIIELTVKKVTKFPLILHSFFLHPIVLSPKLEMHHEQLKIVKLTANQDH